MVFFVRYSGFRIIHRQEIEARSSPSALLKAVCHVSRVYILPSGAQLDSIDGQRKGDTNYISNVVD